MNQGLSIVIVNYFSEKYITPLVETIVSSIKLENYEVIIVSNSPSHFEWNDDYLSDHHIRIIDTGKNEGFGIAINKGVEYSKYDHFCMLNPDIEIEDNTMDELYDFFQTVDDDVGAVSCLIKSSDGVIQKNFFMDKGLQKKSFTLMYLKQLFPGKIRQYLFNDKAYQKS